MDLATIQIVGQQIHPLIGILIAISILGGTTLFGKIIIYRYFKSEGLLLSLLLGTVFISQLSFTISPLGTLGVCVCLFNQKWDMRNNAKSHPRPSYMQWKYFPR